MKPLLTKRLSGYTLARGGRRCQSPRPPPPFPTKRLGSLVAGLLASGGMDIGVTFFATDLTATPADVAIEAEQRGFASLYVPEHTHMPVDQKTELPTGADELDDGYRRTLDPWIALAMAAQATTTIRLGTGVALVAQHDPIALAKQIATLDHLSGGRIVLGVGYGWNRAEIGHHGVDFARRRDVVRDHVLAMQALWRDDVARYDGDAVRFDDSWAWPKPVQRPRVRTLLGGAPSPRLFAEIAEWGDGWIPFGGAGAAGAQADLQQAFTKAGRDPADAWIVPFGTLPSEGKLDHYRELGVQEVVLRIPAADLDTIRRTLDDFTSYL